MAQGQGETVEVDPRSFLVTGQRLFLFYDGFFADTRKSWLKHDPAALEKQADANWKRISGESPRSVPLPEREGEEAARQRVDGEPQG
jgi:hypothetical protein